MYFVHFPKFDHMFYCGNAVEGAEIYLRSLNPPFCGGISLSYLHNQIIKDERGQLSVYYHDMLSIFYDCWLHQDFLRLRFTRKIRTQNLPDQHCIVQKPNFCSFRTMQLMYYYLQLTSLGSSRKLSIHVNYTRYYNDILRLICKSGLFAFQGYPGGTVQLQYFCLNHAKPLIRVINRV